PQRLAATARSASSLGEWAGPRVIRLPLVEVGHPPELGDAVGDLLAGQPRDPLDPELLDVEGRECGAVRHRPGQDLVPERRVRVSGYVAQEATGEAVPRAGRVDDVL